MAKTKTKKKPCGCTGNNECDDCTDEIWVRGKWIMDGAKTIDEAVQKLHEYGVYLNELKAKGWELKDEISGDYGFLAKVD